MTGMLGVVTGMAVWGCWWGLVPGRDRGLAEGTMDDMQVGRRPFARPLPPTVFDRLLAYGFTLCLLAALLAAWWVDRNEHIAAEEWFKAAAQLASTLSLLWRRRHPILVAVFCALLSIPDQVVAMPWALYAVGAYTEDRRRVWAWVVPLSVLWARPWDISTVADQVGTILIGVAPALYGLYVASRRRLIAALAERAERAEREQELRAEQARSEERARLAGEMHDVVTHRVSLMVLQAGALRTRATDEAVKEAAEDLRLVGCQALEELRNLVAILRTEDRFGSALSAEPAALDLSDLVADSRAAGVVVDLDVDTDVDTDVDADEGRAGNPTGSSGESSGGGGRSGRDTAGRSGGRSSRHHAPVASPVVVRTAYRIVQESLTNVHKHAPGARVTVQVRQRGGWLRLQVRNSPPCGPDRLVFAGEGTGLRGLRQRVELVDGSLRAGPTGDGGFEVAADLPTGPPVESAGTDTTSGAA